MLLADGTVQVRLSVQDAIDNLKYGVGIALNTALAYWLLSEGFTWIAGILFACSVFMLLIGFVWYWIWFAQRNAAVWYVTGVTLLAGTMMLSAGLRFGIGGIALCGLSAFLFALAWASVCGVWRLLRFFVARLSRVLLIGISKIGAAWRGELSN